MFVHISSGHSCRLQRGSCGLQGDWSAAIRPRNQSVITVKARQFGEYWNDSEVLKPNSVWHSHPLFPPVMCSCLSERGRPGKPWYWCPVLCWALSYFHVAPAQTPKTWLNHKEETECCGNEQRMQITLLCSWTFQLVRTVFESFALCPTPPPPANEMKLTLEMKLNDHSEVKHKQKKMMKWYHVEVNLFSEKDCAWGIFA